MKITASSKITSTVVLLLVRTGHNAQAFSPIAPPTAARSRVSPPHRISTIPSMSLKDNSMEENDSLFVGVREPINPKPVLFSFLDDLTKDKDHMKTASTSLALALALMILPMNAEAAMSGGRMGGSFSTPRQTMSRPSRPSSSSFSRGYPGGYSRGFYSRPSTTIITPGFGYNPVVPYYYGSPGVMTYSRGPGFFDILFLGGFMLTLATVLSRAGTSVSDSVSSSDFSEFFDSAKASSSLGTGSSVIQLSLALEVPDRDDPNSILGVLDRLAQTAKTDSRVGIQNLTSQVALELLRRRSSITSASSSYQHFRDRNKAGREFQSISVKERSKFEKEVVSKYGGVDYSLQGSKPQKGDGKATMAVITILLNIDGDSSKVPRIGSMADVESALRKIASDAKVDDCLQSAEILWTPEDRTETLSLRDIIADYPELRAI